MKNVKKMIPWWLKIVVKIVLARLPVPYAFWKRLGLFEHGDMNQEHRAWEVFLGHASTANVLDLAGNIPKLRVQGDEYSVLELGPGDSLFTAVIAKSLGASKTWLVDSGYFADTTFKPYADLIGFLHQQGLTPHFATRPQTVDDILTVCQAEYLTDGVRSLENLPSNSVDYSFSNAVLEHILKSDFAVLSEELFRVMKPHGVSVHRVDLRDHMGGQLNNLRFADATWEGTLFRKSGFYTNRIRFFEMISFFEQIGFNCQVSNVGRWNELPTPRARLAEPFSQLPESDLLVNTFDVVLRRR